MTPFYLRNRSWALQTIGEEMRDLAFGLIIAAVAFLVFTNSLCNGFVWDDENVIKNNQALRASVGSLYNRVDTASKTELTPYYRPVALLTFLVEERLHGLDPFWMHFVNVLLHAANALLVYFLARSLLQDASAALLAGLLFAVHPINVESVNFLSGGRNTMLACLCALLTYLLHRKSIHHKRIILALFAALFFLAGLLAKEMAFAILPFIIAMEFKAYQDAAPGGLYQAVARLILYAGAALAYSLLRFNALSGAGVHMEILQGLGPRLLDNIYIIPRYLLSVLWPVSISAKYFVPDDFHLLALPLALAWICIISLLGWLLTRGRSATTLFGLAWFVVFLLPVSGVIAFPSAPLADRYLYAPAIGLWIILADQIKMAVPPGTGFRRYKTAAAMIVLFVMAGLSVAGTTYWKSDVALFTRIIDLYPDRAFGYHNLGCAYLDKVGDLDAAEKEFMKALSHDPVFPRLHTQLGYVRFLKQDFAGAIRYYNEAVKLNINDAEAILNRGIAFEKLGMLNEALTDYRLFLEVPVNELDRMIPFAEGRVRELSSR